MLEANIQKHIDLLVQRYPVLDICKEDIEKAYRILEECYTHDGKLLIAGNGGSAADSEHIAGELMKRFKTPRPVPADFAEKLQEVDSVRGPELAKNLERGLMAIPLVAHEALSTAYINDVDGLGVFAQQLYGFGRPGDVFLGISTSGNSKNIMIACTGAQGDWVDWGQGWRIGERSQCGDSGSGDGDLYDSGAAFAGVSLFVPHAGGTLLWKVNYV